MKPGITSARWLHVCLCIGILVLAFSEPAAFLDQKAATAILRLVPRSNNALASKLVLPSSISDDELAQKIMSLKQQGVCGVLLMVAPRGRLGVPSLRSALASPNVIWAADLSEMDPGLVEVATCRPILICNSFGSAQIAEPGRNGPRSAAAMALNCSGDVATFKRLGCSSFKLLFRRTPYPLFCSGKDSPLVCVTTDDVRSSRRYNTPAGTKAISDYTLDICQALLDRRYLLDVDFAPRCIFLIASALALGLSPNWRWQLFFWGALLAGAVVSALVQRVYLPVGAVFLACVLFRVIGGLWPMTLRPRVSDSARRESSHRGASDRPSPRPV